MSIPTSRTSPPPLPPLPKAPAPLQSALPRADIPAPPLVLVPPGTPDPDNPLFQQAYRRLADRPSAMIRISRTAQRNVERARQLFLELRLARRLGQVDQAQLNKWLVSVYKLVGFLVLTVIVLALVSYLVSNLYYYAATGWITPTVIAPTDEHVLQLSSTLAVQASARDKLVADVADADRVVAMQSRFLDEAHKAIADELRDRQSELGQLLALRNRMSSTRADVNRNSGVYSGLSRARLKAEMNAHLIDRESAVTGAFQLSQIGAANLGLAERGVALDTHLDDLVRQTSSLAAVVGKTPAQRHSYEVLRMVADVQRAELELAKARDYREALGKSLARYEHIVQTIEGAPYLRAAVQKDVIALVPYENLAKVKAGAPLYGCALGLFFCHRIGHVVALLPGEMQLKHPLHNTMLRGQAVQLQLDDARLAEKPVLFVGGRPILF